MLADAAEYADNAAEESNRDEAGEVSESKPTAFLRDRGRIRRRLCLWAIFRLFWWYVYRNCCREAERVPAIEYRP